MMMIFFFFLSQTSLLHVLSSLTRSPRGTSDEHRQRVDFLLHRFHSRAWRHTGCWLVSTYTVLTCQPQHSVVPLHANPTIIWNTNNVLNLESPNQHRKHSITEGKPNVTTLADRCQPTPPPPPPTRPQHATCTTPTEICLKKRKTSYCTGAHCSSVDSHCRSLTVPALDTHKRIVFRNWV